METNDDVVYRVKDNLDYIKDENTGAVLNTNTTKLKEYKNRKQQANKINELEKEIQALKEIVKDLILRGSNGNTN